MHCKNYNVNKKHNFFNTTTTNIMIVHSSGENPLQVASRLFIRVNDFEGVEINGLLYLSKQVAVYLKVR